MSWIGAAIGAASALASAGASQYSSSKAYRRSVNSAQHAHQWEVGDLKAAGLNPILSANGGASAQSFMAQTPVIDIADAMAKEEQSALAVAQSELTESQAALNTANAAKAVNDIAVQNQGIAESKQRVAESQTKQGLMTQQTAESGARMGVYPAQVQSLRAQAMNNMASASLNSAQATEVGLRNDWAARNPQAFDTNMALGRGTTAGQLFNISDGLVNLFTGNGGAGAGSSARGLSTGGNGSYLTGD